MRVLNGKLCGLFKLLSVVFFVLFSVSCIWAAEFRIDRWTTAEGLPQNTINAIVQTRDGYLWLGTFGGLTRFDGVRFTIFNTVNAPAIKSQRITALYEDRAGILWIASETGEISCYRDGEFRSFDDGEEEQIDALYADTRGFLWAGGRNGARRYRLPENPCSVENHNFERIKPPPINNQSSDQISTVLETEDGDIWLNNYGLSKEKTGRLLRWRENAPLEIYGNSDGLPGTVSGEKDDRMFISDIALARIDGKESLLVADQSGVFRFDGKRFVKEISQTGSANDRVRFTYDREGNLIVNFIDSIARLTKEDCWELLPAEELEGKQARSFFADREGNMWLGTFTDGLWRLKRNFIESFDESKGVAKNQTAAVMEDSRGNLWIAGYGLHRFENGKFVREQTVPEAYFIALAEQRDGTLLIGGYDKFFARRADGSVTDLTNEIKAVIGNVPFAIKSICEDSRGNLWLGFRDKGLLRRDTKGNYQHLTTADGLIGNQVQYIAETKDGAVWFGILGGASRYENGKFTNYTIADGFINTNIRAITETADGNIYFGTYGGGLSRLKNGVIRSLTMHDGLFDDVVSRIIVDDKENFWMLGNQGVFTVGKNEIDAVLDGASAQLFCRSFGTADGMISAEGNGGSQPAGWLARDKRFWFPTIRGYVAITPPEPENFLPPAVIEEVKIDNKAIDLRQAIEIYPGDQNLEIRYTGLSFNRSEQLRFRYKLEGYDENWTEVGMRRTAYYSYPPPGEYVFTVQAANADGVWNEQSANLKLNIMPPFYRTWWFYILVVLLSIGLGYAVFSYRVARLNRAKEAQEALSRRLIQLQEEERKRIAGDLHDSLSQNLVIIKNRAMLSLAERDDLDSVFEQIEEIAEAAGDSLDEVREIASNLRPFQIDRLGLTKAVEALVRKTNTPKLKISARTEKIDGLLKPEMEINLYRIIQESLNNIVKHSCANSASLEIRREGKMIQIIIRDNGKGFDFQDIHRTEPANGNGFGLMGIYERARILGTVPQIETNPENGTTIRLNITL
jgi:signal transduction histidine kinase/ligand-binding sensor domain-containing protein